MSDLPTCPRCDARTDPYGRDGGHSYCRKCREEVGLTDYVHGEGFAADEQLAELRRRAA